jgi:hypothetical protein
MDRMTGSLQGVYQNPVQPGDEPDFWSRPLKPAQQQAQPAPEPVADPSQYHPDPQFQSPQQPQAQQPAGETPPQQPQDDTQQQLMQMRAELARIQQEKQAADQQRQWEEHRQQQRTRLTKYREDALSSIQQRDDIDDDTKKVIAQGVREKIDGLLGEVDTQFNQYNQQVEGAFQQLASPFYIAQVLQQNNLPLSLMEDVAALGIPANALPQAVPKLKEWAEARRNQAQTQASEAARGAAPTAQVTGYGTSAPSGSEPEPGSSEHLAQLLVGF